MSAWGKQALMLSQFPRHHFTDVPQSYSMSKDLTWSLETVLGLSSTTTGQYRWHTSFERKSAQMHLWLLARTVWTDPQFAQNRGVAANTSICFSAAPLDQSEHHLTVSVDLLGAVHPSLSLSWVTMKKLTYPAFLSSLLTLHISSSYAECVML